MGAKKYAGLPLTTVSKEQQLASIKQNTDVQQQGVAVLNKLLESKGFQLSKVNTKQGTKWRITDNVHGTIVGEYTTPEAAQKAANNL